MPLLYHAAIHQQGWKPAKKTAGQEITLLSEVRNIDYLGLGDKEQAFVWLGRAADEKSDIMKFLKVHPFFDSLRGDPRFAEFLRRANLTPQEAIGEFLRTPSLL